MTNRLPVIVSIGGYNAAGRVSGHHAYRRMVLESLSAADRNDTYRSLASLMNLDGDPTDPERQAFIRDHTLIRKIESFDPHTVYCQTKAKIAGDAEGERLSFAMARRQMPTLIPDNWTLTDIDDRHVRVEVAGILNLMLPDARESAVCAAGQLPTGFDPGKQYASRNHPRGLQLAVCGASDAIHALGIPLETLKARVPPEQWAVYSASAMSQMDPEGYGGLMQNPMTGKRPTSKQVALALPQMPADFINAYVLGSVGSTAGIIGACATYLYNLKQGVEDIRAGRCRVVVVGNSEAPVVPDVIEGYRTMGALATDEAIMQIDGTDAADHRRMCRPFSTNAGFTVAEGAVYTILMDDELALDLGADILGSVSEVFVHADGFKKSIPGPGIGNYLTFARSLAATRALVGEETLRRSSYVQAHGTGTPQNRVTESHIINELAAAFGISNWPVGAIKAFVGHTMAPAGADQMAAILGAWQYGLIPGIKTIDHIADDVHSSNLNFPMQDLEFDPAAMTAAFINSKGFGGNNATGAVLSPDFTRQMLTRRWGKERMLDWERRSESVRAARADYDAACLAGSVDPIYQFGEGVLDGPDLTLTSAAISIPGYDQPLELDPPNPYPDMSDPDAS